MNSAPFSIEKKVILFTGGAGHIVGALVEFCASLGAICISADLRPEKLEGQAKKIQEKNLHLQVATLDVTEPDHWESLTQSILKDHGRIDALVNGAGINAPSTFFDIDVSTFRKILDVNLVGTLLGCQIVGKHMVENGKGSIINISSTSADPPLSKAFAYSASKAGVTNLTKNIAREFGTTGVRVNSLRPGFFPTEWNKKNFLSEERIASIMTHTPMKRFGEPEELTGAVVWLISDLSSFVTGSEIVVDGGFSAQTI
jgi:NAD(P)-dependent dehydrogenase (short-subunit alcohol dehydrogenase family)